MRERERKDEREKIRESEREEDRRGRALMYELAPRIGREREGERESCRDEESGRDKIFASKGIKYDFICSPCCCYYYHHRARGDLRELAVPLPSLLSDPRSYICVYIYVCAACFYVCGSSSSVHPTAVCSLDDVMNKLVLLPVSASAAERDR